MSRRIYFPLFTQPSKLFHLFIFNPYNNKGKQELINERFDFPGPGAKHHSGAARTGASTGEDRRPVGEDAGKAAGRGWSRVCSGGVSY